MVEYDLDQEEKNIYLSEQSNMIKYLPKLNWGKNVKYFVFWVRSANFKNYKDQSAKRHVVSDFLSTNVASGVESPRHIRNERKPTFPKGKECHVTTGISPRLRWDEDRLR